MRKVLVAAFLAAVIIPALPRGAPARAAEPSDSDDVIAEITVNARRVANLRPAGTYAAPATTLRYDPLTELQSRGLAEGQSDVAVRGGVFENTGFKLGAVTVMDPQTGHYVAELPVDPSLMTAPAIFKSIDNAVEGFNSAIATVSFAFRPVTAGGTIGLGVGSDALQYQAMRLATVFQDDGPGDYGAALSVARSEGSGSVTFGDHEFARANLQLQRRTAVSQSDLLLAYQDKFYGWPGAYTGFATLPETDDTQTTLVLANHRHATGHGWWELGGFYRQLEDDYDFDRRTVESGVPGSFEHETRNFALGLQGLHRAGRIRWRYGAQVTSDELVRSTDLTNGFFNDRDYATLTVVPSIEQPLADDTSLTWRVGTTIDYSDRDDTAVSPLAGVTLSRIRAHSRTDLALEYAETTQVPGYTALNANPTGLFGGNPALGRESARQLALSITHEADEWRGRAALFGRRDDDLVDWTFATGAPFARQASPVDIDVIGFEAFLTRAWDRLELAAGYAWIDKDADYGTAQVDASFYALNYARHRATLALTYRFADDFELRLDNEYRHQADNPLRDGGDSTYLGSVALAWNARDGGGFSAALVVDNISDSDFQPFPGTPAAGRQVSLTAGYTW